MKYSFTLIILLFTICSCSKKLNQEKQQLNIEQKAKLLTVSEYGITNSEIILEEVLNQDLKYIDFGYENFLFMEITLNQSHWYGYGKQGIAENLYCERLVVYNKKNHRFYRIFRDNYNDVHELVNDIYSYELQPLSFISNRNDDSIIDLFCVFDFVKDKGSSNFDCISNCGGNIIIR